MAPVVLQSTSQYGGDWIFNPFTTTFTDPITDGSILLGVGQGFTATNVTVDDTLGNSWTQLNPGNNYGIGWSGVSGAGSDTLNFDAETPGINTHSGAIFGIEIGDVVSFNQIQTSSGSDSVISGSISLPDGDYSFTTESSYPYSWALNFVYFNGHAGTGILFAVINVLDVAATAALDTISGWTGILSIGGTAVWTTSVLPTAPAPVRVFVNTGPTRPISSV